MKIQTIAFYGAGMLGSGFVKSLRRQGYDVRVWNRTFSKAQALEAAGARAFEDAAEAARGADAVHLCLRDGDTVDGALAAAMSGIAPGTPVIDHTTVAVDSVVPRAQRLQAAGLQFLSAPVFMGPAHAESAQGTMLASGPQALYDALESHLATMTGKLRYFGENYETAATYKLLGNAMILAVIGGVNDVLRIADARGMSRESAFEIFSIFDPSLQIQGRGKKMAAGDFTPAWTLEMARKDARLMQAAAHHTPLPVIDGVEAALARAEAGGLGAHDLGAIAAR
jgi:3-hydroxyisobutyrate dehydrogenase-like beta-hydroxyacid dehydrogenase